MTLHQHAENIYLKMNSYANPAEMRGIEKAWIIQKIKEGCAEWNILQQAPANLKQYPLTPDEATPSANIEIFPSPCINATCSDYRRDDGECYICGSTKDPFD